MNINAQEVRAKLEEVMDPELNMAITDLGLVYDVQMKDDGGVYIQMTLTTIGCPLFNVIEDEIKIKLQELEIKPEKIQIDLTFDPPWSMERMTERGKAILGI